MIVADAAVAQSRENCDIDFSARRRGGKHLARHPYFREHSAQNVIKSHYCTPTLASRSERTFKTGSNQTQRILSRSDL